MEGYYMFFARRKDSFWLTIKLISNSLIKVINFKMSL